MKRITLLLVATTFVLLGLNAQAPFAAGSGTEADPYQISTAEELYQVRNFMGSHFILLNNIDVSTDYPVWLPIGKPEGTTDSPDYEYFSGVFDGNGFTVSGVNIEYHERYVGFFTTVSGTIKNFGIVGSVTNNSTKADTGLLTGYLRNTAESPAIVENCFADGHVHYPNTTDAHVGVLVGRQAIVEASIIRNCYVKGSVTGNANYVGGIVGRQGQKTIQVINCYSEADVSGNDYVGGVVGQIYGDGVSNCYATGNVSGNSSVGGVVGRLYSGSISSRLIGANSSVEATTSDVGRVIGALAGSATHLYGLDATVIKLDDNIEAATSSSSGKDGETKTFTELEDQDLYTGPGGMGWDFDDVWGMPKDGGLPKFRYNTDIVFTGNAALSQTGKHKLIYQNGEVTVLGLAWNSQIQLIDLSGRTIDSSTATGAKTIQLPGKGVYILKITHENRQHNYKVAGL